ncbi:MAG: phosphoribosylformylglycinamidine cyclo-ligase [Ruminococcaceae bacterium]|nr:phosphoribosylformylglycinamidine cyclo-ligase [Oscillospiraceae bacterium]
MSNAYKAAGVDVTAGYEAVNLMKKHVKKTFIDGVMTDIGGFGGLFEIGTNYKNPVLVSGTDGVGTKLKIAFLTDKHNTIGQDCVAMCANDIACSGAKPLFFLDYLAVGKNVPEKVADIVSGVADGCVMSGCALIGGETAEMPGFYSVDEYDLAGFCVGIVDKENIIDGKSISVGDTLIGVASSGVHSNGYSLVRKIFDLNCEDSLAKEKLNKYYDELGKTLGEELITPTKIYVKTILGLNEQVKIKGISHITGGGFYENIPRMLNEGQSAKVIKDSFEVLPIFKLMAKLGEVSQKDMFNTFNMGIGLVMAVDKNDAEKAVDILNKMGEKAYIIGEVISGTREVEIC